MDSESNLTADGLLLFQSTVALVLARETCLCMLSPPRLRGQRGQPTCGGGGGWQSRIQHSAHMRVMHVLPERFGYAPLVGPSPVAGDGDAENFDTGQDVPHGSDRQDNMWCMAATGRTTCGAWQRQAGQHVVHGSDRQDNMWCMAATGRTTCGAWQRHARQHVAHAGQYRTGRTDM